MPPKQTYTTGEYAAFFREGDERGFDYFFREYYTPLCSLAYRKIADQKAAEDLVSDAFIKVWKHHSQFSSEAGIRAYLFQVVKNDCLHFLKQQSRHRCLAESELPKFQADENNAMDLELVRMEFVRLLYSAINELAPQSKKVFELLFIKGKSIPEAADILHISRSSVKTYKSRGLEILRKQLSINLPK